MKKGWDKRKYDRREGRKSSRFIDRTGMIAHRLLYLEWLGKWHGMHYWKALCECGNTIETVWKIADVRSCGCLQRENRKNHGWETQRPDGRWGLKNEMRLRLTDGTITTAARMAAEVGITHQKMNWRIRHWPEERWREPKHYTGAAAKQRGELKAAKASEKTWHRRPQPWASATMKRVNEDGLAYRKTKPASAEPSAAGPGQDDCPTAAGDAAAASPER